MNKKYSDKTKEKVIEQYLAGVSSSNGKGKLKAAADPSKISNRAQKYILFVIVAKSLVKQGFLAYVAFLTYEDEFPQNNFEPF